MIVAKSRIAQIMFLFLFAISCSGHSGNNNTSDDAEPPERIGVLRSTDHGATWTFIGYASFNAPTLIPVDPSPLATDNGIALYFLDLAGLGKPAGTPRVIYRAVTTDALLFTPPVQAFSYPEDMTDPYVLQMPNESCRLYLQAVGRGIISASSSDGLEFTLEDGERSIDGGTPGALVTPDGDIRLFFAGESGISSALSGDGLTFVSEQGERIPKGSYRLIADPHPIRLQSGSYLMSYIRVPSAGEPPLDNEMRLAGSIAGFDWTENPVSLRLGANPGLVETADGTLYIYFVDFHAAD
jgi:hypothetical protein